MPGVGAGAGSYEPVDREVTAVEPSTAMRVQRPPYLAPALDATAEQLPFPDGAFDAGMATFSVYQWRSRAAGLQELRRVVRGPAVIPSCDPARVQHHWLADYAPEVLATEAGRYPTLAHIAAVLGGHTDVLPVPIPLPCRDGFNEAYYGRPEALLDAGARRACPAWRPVAPAVAERAVRRLASDLADGARYRPHGHLRRQPEYDGSLRLVVSRP